MTSVLRDTMISMIQAIESGFLFRKLGICYDYRAADGSFPPSTLPDAREISQHLPNPTGRGTGLEGSWQTGAILLDAMLLRVEYGYATPEEDRLFDRLIGGLIRLGAMGNKGTLIRSLAVDGRSAYPEVDADVHLYWAFHAWRAYSTAAIAPESQEKLENIGSKWIHRLMRDEFSLERVNGEPDRSLLEPDAEQGCKLLAILAAAWGLTDEEELADLFDKKRLEAGGIRIAGELPDEAKTPMRLLAMQLAWSVLRECAPQETLRDDAPARMKKIAAEAIRHLQASAPLDIPLLSSTPTFDWRTVDDSVFSTWPTGWERMAYEVEAVQNRLAAVLTLFLAGDRELALPHAEGIASFLESLGTATLCHALSPALVLSCHAHGVELGLWDPDLAEYAFSFDGQANLVDKYMGEDYDEAHPEQAGHTESRRRPLETVALPDEGGRGGEKGGSSSGGRNKRRRRRRKRTK